MPHLYRGCLMGADLNRRTWQPKDIATPAERRAAALYVTSVATDKDDATDLLAALGLLPAGHPALFRDEDHGSLAYQAGCRCKTCRKWNAQRTRRQRAAKTGATK